MYTFVNMKEYGGGLEKAIKYYHSKWGNKNNYTFFCDAISHSKASDAGLPRFYLLLRGDEIVGCCGLIVNDFISRHDLLPWLAGIYIEESERGKELGKLMMQHAEHEAAGMGYSKLYLSTSHDGYYEKYGWKRIEDGYEPSGEATRIYEKKL